MRIVSPLFVVLAVGLQAACAALSPAERVSVAFDGDTPEEVALPADGTVRFRSTFDDLVGCAIESRVASITAEYSHEVVERQLELHASPSGDKVAWTATLTMRQSICGQERSRRVLTGAGTTNHGEAVLIDWQDAGGTKFDSWLTPDPQQVSVRFQL